MILSPENKLETDNFLIFFNAKFYTFETNFVFARYKKSDENELERDRISLLIDQINKKVTFFAEPNYKHCLREC
jgi:hypothetical protein